MTFKQLKSIKLTMGSGELMSPMDTAYQIRESGISISQANNKKSIEAPKLHFD